MNVSESFSALNDSWDIFKEKIRYHFKIGPFVIRLEFIDADFAAKIIPALNHLIIADIQQPDLIVSIWDTALTQQPMPKLNWHLINRNGYHGYSEENICFHYFDSIDALSAINLDTNHAFYIVKNSKLLPWWVSGSPLQVIFHVWLRHKNYQIAHTAAVGNDKAAVLLCGKSGSGKSTTTLSCISAGLNVIGEDYCVLDDKTLQVYSLYQSAKWTNETCDLFPHYQSYIQNKPITKNEKALIYFNDLFPERIKLSASVCATVSLTVGEKTMPMLKRVSYEEALKNLMISSLLQLPLFHSKTIMLLKNFIYGLGSNHYQLILGKNRNNNIKMIEALMQ